MIVFEICAVTRLPHPDKRYYSLLTSAEAVWNSLQLFEGRFDGTPYPRKWKSIEMFLEHPNLPRANFLYTGGGAFVCDEMARELAGEALEMSGELLPVKIEGVKGKFWIYNNTNVINVLDAKKSKWQSLGRNPDGTVARMLERPAFIAERFGEECLFKIIEDRCSRIYCVEHTGDPDDGELKAVVQHHKLTGLTFDLVWTDEKTPVVPKKAVKRRHSPPA